MQPVEMLGQLGRVVVMLQRVWRKWTYRRIFYYFRDLVKFREQGDARELLRCINPREAAMMDAASAVHVRFRLGGSTFPPTVFYKIFTHAPVADVGAYAPRDYTSHFQPPPIMLHNNDKPGRKLEECTHSGWYKRVENNGWRPVAGTALQEFEGVVAAKPVPWHHSKLVRRETLAKQRKQKKLEWLQKMYKIGKEGADVTVAALSSEGHESVEGEGEDDIEQLLKWSDDLDFDSYLQDWMGLATSSRSTVADPVTFAAGTDVYDSAATAIVTNANAQSMSPLS